MQTKLIISLVLASLTFVLACDDNGGSNDNQSTDYPYVCNNGTPAPGRNIAENIESCVACESGYTLSEEGAGRTCLTDTNPTPLRHKYVCENGEVATGTTNTPNLENCASCKPGYTRTILATTSRYNCIPNTRTTHKYICFNGRRVEGTTDRPNVENCSTCNTGYTRTPISTTSRHNCIPNTRTTHKYICFNGNRVTGTTDRPNVLSCASCHEDRGYHLEFINDVSGPQRCVANAYRCPNGTPISNPFLRPASHNTITSCAVCDRGYHPDFISAGSGPQRCVANAYRCPNGIVPTSSATQRPRAHDTISCGSCRDTTATKYALSPPMAATGVLQECAVDTDDDDIADVDDDDDDGDGVADSSDLCPRGHLINWTSNVATDRDGDGCRDSDEDVDDDNDGLIDIHDLEMLHHIRHKLDGTSYKAGASAMEKTTGAPIHATANCTITRGRDHDRNSRTPNIYLCGYELMRDLDFADDNSYGGATPTRNTMWCPTVTSNDCNDSSTSNANQGFPGIGAATGSVGGFASIFEGNGYIISNLYMRNTNNTNEYWIGLFRRTENTAKIRNLGLVNANVYGGNLIDRIGGLVGRNKATIVASYARGNIAGGSGNDFVGGLVGFNESTGIIIASYATGSVGGDNGTDEVGGLVGENNGGTITASYARATASGGGHRDSVGGLVGGNTGSITASYATGNANGDSGIGDSVGGLVGANSTGASITASYATGNANGGSGNGDFVGGLTATNAGTITASYATGQADGSAGTGDNAGPLIGNSSSTATDSYGFTAAVDADSGDTPNTNHTRAADCGTDSMQSCTLQKMLSPGATATAANNEWVALASWNQSSSGTSEAWNFGTTSQAPTLLYADYDAGSATHNCSNYPIATICGATEIAGQTDTDNDGVFDVTDKDDDNDGVCDGDAAVTASAVTPGDGVPSGGCTAGDIDDDNDGLIEIDTLEKLSHMQHNLAGTSYKSSSGATGNTTGRATSSSTVSTATATCGSGVYLCGYELTRNLNFAQSSSYASGTVNTTWCPNTANDHCAATTGTGFVGVGAATGSTGGFVSIFEGNGYTIRNLYMRYTGNTGQHMGLFRQTASGARIRNVGVLGAHLYGDSGNDNIGGLVGTGPASITASYVTGKAYGGDGNDNAGGLVGLSSASIATSYATGKVYGGDGNDNVGGLLGSSSSSASITASYARSNAYGDDDNDNVGGLVGSSSSSASITASYAAGNADGGAGNDDVGGLVGNNSSTIIASYARGNVSTGENAGALVGRNHTGTTTASYGFGTPRMPVDSGSLGSFSVGGIPSSTSVNALQISDSSTTSTYVGTNWAFTGDTSGTSSIWDFGNASTPPKLKFYDIDGSSSGTDYCGSVFLPRVCGKLIPGQ